jgi:MFS family permease
MAATPSQAPGSAAPSADRAFSWRFVTPLLAGSTLNPINSSLIATALVPIAASVYVSIGRTALLVSSLYLASAIAQPTGGKLAEEFGPRRVFLLGILLVLAGGLVGGLAHSLTTLIVARVLIGIGTSGGYPSAMLLVRRRAEAVGLQEPPGGVLGGLVIAGMVTPALGLPIGGLLVGWTWRATFLINVPVALITLAMAMLWIPRDAPLTGSRSLREIAARIDLAGILGFAGALAALLVFLMSLPGTPWLALALAAVLSAALVWWELRASRPFFDVRLLATNLALTRTYARVGLATLCVYTVLYGVTQWLEVGRGLSSSGTGLLLLPMSAIAAVIARPIAKRNLLRMPLLLGAAACLAASAGVLVLTSDTALGWIILVTLGFGVTLGASLTANQTALFVQVRAAQMGTASGLYRTFGYLGSIASSALISIVFHNQVSDHHLHIIALVMVAVSVVGMLLVLGDHRLMSHRTATDQERG